MPRTTGTVETACAPFPLTPAPRPSPMPGTLTLARIFHTPERRVRARGLQERRCVLVGRVPSRGALLAFPTECEISRLASPRGSGDGRGRGRPLAVPPVENRVVEMAISTAEFRLKKPRPLAPCTYGHKLGPCRQPDRLPQNR